MEHIAHDSIFEYLSVDIDKDEDELRMKLREMGTQSFISYLKNSEAVMYETPCVLNTELKDSMGNVLINKDIPLDKYLDQLLDRYITDECFSTSPFAIKSSSKVLKRYREKTAGKVSSQIKKTIAEQSKYKKFYRKLESGEIKTQPMFEWFMTSLLSDADGISLVLKMTKHLGSHKSTFAQTTNSTYISISLTLIHISRAKNIDGNSLLQKICCTTFLQDIGVFSGLASTKAPPAERCKKSAFIASKLCREENVSEAILHKHTYTNDDGKPLFQTASNRNNFCLNLLMTVNLFIDIVNNNQFAPENIEVHKAMYELAELGYADKTIVSLIGELFLPRLNHQLLEYAFKIQAQCTQKPAVWGVAGDMLPIKFICQKGYCEKAGQHKTFVPKDVEIAADQIYETKT